MKRKKWSELEELTLLNKYSDLLTSGALAKLKTREKKFKPIADCVNSLHHLQDPINFPFKWSWRDVSIKVHNMRHQYLGVKQKIRIPNGDFNWNDGEDHWENFLKYKEVFGDVDLETKSHIDGNDINRRFSVGGEFGDEGAAEELFGENGVMGLEIGMESEEMEDEEEEDDAELGENVGLGINENGFEEREDTEDSSFDQRRKLHKGLGAKKLRMLGAQVLELRDVMLRREIKRKEREWSKEDVLMEREQRRRTRETWKESRDFERDEKMEMREIEFEERQMAWARKEYDRRVRLEREIDEEKRRRMKMEEKWEEEKMDLREKMMGMQIEYEKQMTQMYANFCQNQSQVLGIVSGLLNQFFGNASSGIGTLGNFPSPVLQNLQHNGGLGDNVKPEGNSENTSSGAQSGNSSRQQSSQKRGGTNSGRGGRGGRNSGRGRSNGGGNHSQQLHQQQQQQQQPPLGSNPIQSGMRPWPPSITWPAAYPPWAWGPWAAPPPCPYPTAAWTRPNSQQAGILGPRPQQAYTTHAPDPAQSPVQPTDIEAAMHTMSLQSPDDNWYFDTGAMSHMTSSEGFTDGDATHEMY